ncbi:S8 family serine peptidase, partial [Patescibacteria group bacterium]|nr:S8 family serine peptidase [Patescibacteria group bacterium]
MIKYSKSFIILSLALLLGASPLVSAAPPASAGETGRFIIIANNLTAKDKVLSHVRGAGGDVISEFDSVPGMAVILPIAAVQGLANNPHVKEIGLDTRVFALDTELDNSWGVKRIGAGIVHGYNTAAGTKVAVIDTGIDYTHSDLDANFAGGYDFVNNDFDPFDGAGHGTHVSGIIASQNTSFKGVAPDANIASAKVLSDS